jgi:hypothetical protein
MNGREIIEWLQKNKAENIEVSVNFSINGNGAYVSPIKDIAFDADCGDVFLGVGAIDDFCKNEYNQPAFPALSDSIYKL